MDNRYEIIKAMEPTNTFFSGVLRFPSRRAAKVCFHNYVKNNPGDERIATKFGYYDWGIYLNTELGEPVLLEEMLSIVRDNPTDGAARGYSMYGCDAALTTAMSLPVAVYKTEDAAMNALLDHIKNTPTIQGDFFAGRILVDVREVHMANVPVLKANKGLYFQRFENNKKAKGGAAWNRHKVHAEDATWTSYISGPENVPTPEMYKGPCHAGNVPILKMGEHTLYAGGISKGVHPGEGMVVVDLANSKSVSEFVGPYSTELKGNMFPSFTAAAVLNGPAAWLDFPLGDYQVPTHVARPAWNAMAKDAKKILGHHDMLFFCQGGHGRTGLAVSILVWLLVSEKTWMGEKPEGLLDDPVKWLRAVYCKEAVDTLDQHKYVYKMLGLNIDPPPYVKAVTPWQAPKIPKATVTEATSLPPANNALCPRCGKVSSSTENFGICMACSNSLKAWFASSEAKGVKWVECSCKNCDTPTTCAGITLMACGHVVHQQTWGPEQVCDMCFQTQHIWDGKTTVTEAK